MTMDGGMPHSVVVVVEHWRCTELVGCVSQSLEFLHFKCCKNALHPVTTDAEDKYIIDNIPSIIQDQTAIQLQGGKEHLLCAVIMLSW